MRKTILVTGSTDGIGLETAKMLVEAGQKVLLHGRNPVKLEHAEKALATLPGGSSVESHVADLSRMAEVESLAKAISKKHDKLDVLINNAGIFKTPNAITEDGLDVRFAVNAIAPYLLTQELMPLLGHSARVINLSSAAQAPVDAEALAGQVGLDDMAAYAQSKLALTMWSCAMAKARKDEGPAIIAVNPGSLLGSKMVQEGFGVAGGDIRVGADILARAALSDEFSKASGQYFDNDKGQFVSPHQDALDPGKCDEVVRSIDAFLAKMSR